MYHHNPSTSSKSNQAHTQPSSEKINYNSSEYSSISVLCASFGFDPQSNLDPILPPTSNLKHQTTDNHPLPHPTSTQSSYTQSTFNSPTQDKPTLSPNSLSLDPTQSSNSASTYKSVCRWTDEDDRKLLSILKQEKAHTPISIHGFRGSTWVTAANLLKGSEIPNTSKVKDHIACRSRWNALKRMYLQLKYLRNLAGATWDEENHKIQLTEQVWAGLLTDSSDQGRTMARWRYKPFPLYDDLASLIEGQIASRLLMKRETSSFPDETSSTTPQLPSNEPTSYSECPSDSESNAPSDQIGNTSSPLKRRLSSSSYHDPQRLRSGDCFLKELKSISSSISQSLIALNSSTCHRSNSTYPSMLVRALTLLQERQEELSESEFFKAVDLLRSNADAETYVTLRDSLRTTWLKMKLEN